MLPPLRERRDDIVPLFREFLREHAGGRPPALDPKLVEALTLYDWPLNVRELLGLARKLLLDHGQRARAQAVAPARGLRAGGGEAPGGARAGGPRRPVARSARAAAPTTRREFAALVAALRLHGNRVAKAAEAIGVSRARAYRLLAPTPSSRVEGLRHRARSGRDRRRAQPERTARLGAEVDRYTIVRLLGKGGMGAVYEARHARLARRVGDQVPAAGAGVATRRSCGASRTRPWPPAASSTPTSSPSSTSARAADGSPYLVMEFLEGEDCARLLRRVGPLPVPRAP